MDYEHELDVLEMQKWLANFDDPEIMRVARTFLVLFINCQMIMKLMNILNLPFFRL